MRSARPEPWFIVSAPRPLASLRLFCFPYAGAGASVYAQWAGALRDLPVELCGIQPPGRENRLGERPFDRLAPMVESLRDAMRPLLDRPFCFFGHSMGTLVAFELTRALRCAALPLPHHLFMSGAHPPIVPRDEEPLAHLPDQEFIHEVAERYGGIPPAVLQHAELMSLVLPVLRADITLLEQYAFEDAAPLACPISAFAGTDDPHVRADDLTRWGELTTGPCTTTFFPGGHFYLQAQRDQLLSGLRPLLAAAAG